MPKLISELPALLGLAALDVLLEIQDPNDLTDDPAGTSYQATLDQLLRIMGDFRFVRASELVANSQAAATANRLLIQDALDNYQGVWLPFSGGVTNAYFIDETILVNDGQTFMGYGATATQLSPINGANLDAVVASRNWYDSSGAPSSSSRNLVISGIGIEGNYLNRSATTVNPEDTTTDIRQTAGLGHGFALSSYASRLHDCGAAQTRGAGVLWDTTGRDGATVLGECIESVIEKCIFTRCGLGGVHVTETVAGAGGITDGFLNDNVIAHCNQRGEAASSDYAHAIFIETGGGWSIKGNHVYGTDGFAPGHQWEGYGATQHNHGMWVKSASGVRVIGNQIADFGYHWTDADDAHGIAVQGQDGNRGVIIANNTIWTDEDGAAKDYYAIRTTTVSAATDVGISITGNVAESRAGAPTMQGFKIDGAGGGTVRGVVNGNTLIGVTATEETSGNATLTGRVNISGNSWQA